MSIHKIKAGQSIPTSADLVDRQIGYDAKNKNLYINSSGYIEKIGGEGTIKPIEDSISGHQYTLGEWDKILFATGENGYEHPDGGRGALPAIFGESGLREKVLEDETVISGHQFIITEHQYILSEWDKILFADGTSGYEHPDGGRGALPAIFGTSGIREKVLANEEIISGLVKKAVIINPRPDTDPSQYRGKRVLLQSITTKKIDQGLLTGWMIDLDSGTEIPYDFDISQIVSDIGSINQAVVNKRPDTDPVQYRGKRVLLQSITAERIDQGVLTGWMVDLDTGNEISYDFPVNELITKVAAINQAIVNPRPTTDPVEFAGKRLLMQSITFEKLTEGKVTGWMIDLDSGTEIPYYYDIQTLVDTITNTLDTSINGLKSTVNAISGVINEYPAIVNPRESGTNQGTRPLLQSFTFENFANNKISAWSVDLNTGDEINNEFDLKPLNIIAKVNPRTDMNDKRVLMQSITFNDFSKDNQTVSGWMIDLDTGNEIAVPIDVSSLVSKVVDLSKENISGNLVKVEPQPSNIGNDSADKRVLMQSITFDGLESDIVKFTGWMVDLDTGNKIAVPFNYSVESLLDKAEGIMDYLATIQNTDPFKDKITSIKNKFKAWMSL
jgi:hypothetical protein